MTKITLAGLVLALGLPVLAHHSGAAVFDNTKKIDLTGVVTSSGPEIFDQPALSFDGAKLGYIRRGQGVRGEEVWIADADGQHRRQLTSGASDSFPAWSVDRQRVLFSRFNQGLFLYDLASGSLVHVTQQRADSMAWSP